MPAGHGACRTANCQQDFMLLGKSQVCNYFNSIPLLFSSKKLFLATGKKTSYTISHTLAFQSHVSRKPPPVFNFISNYMTANMTKLYFLKTMPLGIQFSSEKKRDMYFQNDGTGLRITVIAIVLFYGNTCITYFYSIQ